MLHDLSTELTLFQHVKCSPILSSIYFYNFLSFKVGHSESDDTKPNIDSNITQSIDYKYSVRASSLTPKQLSEIGESNFRSFFDEPIAIHSNVNTKAKRRPRIKRKWRFERKFTSYSDATNFVNCENIWSKWTTNSTSQGRKILYRCRRAKLKGQQCEAGMSLLFCSGSGEVLLHRAENPHTCHINCSPSPRNPMTVELRDTISRIFRDGRRKRKEIEEQLVAEGIDIPPSTQFNTLIRYLNCKHINNR